MKKHLYRLVSLVVMVILLSSVVYAGGVKGQAGLGFLLTDRSSAVQSRIWVSNYFTFEPEISFSSVQPSGETSAITRYSPGLGFAYHFRPGLDMRPYLGLRLGMDVLSASDETFIDMAVAPMLGCEYFFSKNFSVGGEVMLSIILTDEEFSPSLAYDDATYIQTMQGVWAHFYF